MGEVLRLTSAEMPQLPPQATCDYEVVRSAAGLSLMSGVAHFSGPTEWTNEEGRGISLGLILQGSIAMDVGSKETDYLAELQSFIWAEPSSVPMRHVVPRSQDLKTISLNVPEQMHDTFDLLGKACHAAIMRRPRKGGIANFHKTPLGADALSIARQIADCSLVGPMRALYLEAKSLELLVSLLQQLQGLDDRRPESWICPRGSAAERLMEARAVLIQEFQSPPSLDELASRIGMCTSGMTAGFRRLFGQTINEFVQERRLNHAFEALRGGQMTVAQAAYSAGYSRAYFSTLFRRKFGRTPGEVSREG